MKKTNEISPDPQSTIARRYTPTRFNTSYTPGKIGCSYVWITAMGSEDDRHPNTVESG
jgi:hypothetical protein